jgi:mono/diheme cytochrome c family protein
MGTANRIPFRVSISASVLPLLLAASLGFVGCKKEQTDDTKPPDDVASGSSTGANADGGDDPSGEDGGAPAAAGWATMDRDARLTYMGTEVMPKMKEAFKQRGFDTFKCANCHGEDYKEVDFKIPNDLTPLNPDNPIQSGMDLDEEMTKFMVSEVLPQMAELLGKETDVTTGKGEFGCLSCHLSE